MQYNWQQSDWPNFSYSETDFLEIWHSFLALSGQSQGYWSASSGNIQNQSIIDLLVVEAIKTSSIEGEFISRIDLISSIKKNLGFVSDQPLIKDKRSAGIAQLLVDSRKQFADVLSEQMLFDWHKLLMLGNNNVSEIGQWRTHTEPMQVVSGAMGKEKVHFQAPLSSQVPQEMKQFIDWYNASLTGIKNPLVRSAIAHLYFESIHPFEDGNGRIGRIIAEKALSESLDKPVLLSISKHIERNKKAYYDALKKGQQSNQIDAWILYFATIVMEAQQDFMFVIALSVQKMTFFDTHQSQLNERQHKVFKKILANNDEPFEGYLNARKYQAIAKTSKATATRDLQDLLEKNLIISKGQGRSTSYLVNFS